MKHSFRLTVLVVGLLVVTLALPGVVDGKASGGGMKMGGKGGKGSSNNKSNSSLSSVQTAQPESPEIVAARKTLDDDKAALDAAVAKVWGPFSQTQAYLDAETAFTQAAADLKAALAALMAKLADSDDYKQAVKDRDDAKAAMQSANSGDDSGATANFADNEAKYLAASAKVGKLEADAAANDPATKAAQAKYDQAKKAVDAQTAQFQDLLKADTVWQAAKKAYDDADANLQTLLAAAKTKQPAKPAPAAAAAPAPAVAPAAPAPAAPAAATAQ